MGSRTNDVAGSRSGRPKKRRKRSGVQEAAKEALRGRSACLHIGNSAVEDRAACGAFAALRRQGATGGRPCPSHQTGAHDDGRRSVRNPHGPAWTRSRAEAAQRAHRDSRRGQGGHWRPPAPCSTDRTACAFPQIVWR